MKKLAIIAILLVITTISCTHEENDSNEINYEVTTADLTITMIENPENGDRVGIVEGISDNGTVSFSIIDQNPEAAMNIDAATGELTVADNTAFEFQINPILTATVSVSVGTNSETSLVTVNLEERRNILIGNVVLTSQDDVDNFGLERYTEISGYLIIGGSNAEDITNLDPILGLNYIGNYLVISFNDHLTDLDGLESIIHVKTFSEIHTNATLNNINGLRYLAKVGDPQFLESGSITIAFNPELQNVDGLLGLTEISSYIHISNNTSLLNIDGLANLESIQYLLIRNNNSITDINALRNTMFIANEIIITGNSDLTDFCGLETVLNTMNYDGIYQVESNEYNPTQQQIIDGECSP
jgi:hypothetical protein